MHARSPKLLEGIRDAAAFIGESVKRLAHVDPDSAARIALQPQIITFRNILMHGYDLVDPLLVWSAVQTQLPSLLRDVAGVAGAAFVRTVRHMLCVDCAVLRAPIDTVSTRPGLSL